MSSTAVGEHGFLERVAGWDDPFGRVRADLETLAPSFDPGLVSIVIPCFNAGAYVGQAIESALTQSHSELEVIVVDDASTDDSADIASRYGDRITLVAREARGGACVARNDGLEIAHGQYVQFLDADDYLLPDAVVARLKATREGATVFGERRELEGVEHWIPSHTNRGWGRSSQGEYLLRKNISTLEPLHLRVPVYEVGGFDESLSQAQDKDLHFRLWLHGVHFEHVNAAVAVQRHHDSTDRLSNVVWMEVDPLRHFNLSMHWLRLLALEGNGGIDRRLLRAACDRIVLAARRAHESGYEQLAGEYVELLKEWIPEYSVGPIARAFGSYDAPLGRRVILGATGPQRTLGLVRQRVRAAVVAAKTGHWNPAAVDDGTGADDQAGSEPWEPPGTAT